VHHDSHIPAGVEVPSSLTDDDTPKKRWYVVHTYSGYENKVKANLEKRIETMEKEDKIFRVVVPIEEEMEIKDGKRKITKRKVFPGYVLVEMLMSDDSWYVVRNTPGVTGFVGSGSKPIPLQPAEVRSILRPMGVDEPRPKVAYSLGESVRVTAGPFEGFVGVIREIHPDKGKLRVFVSMFGRETPIELDFSQVEKL
jgi:transcription termination/antitermination protein NusG